MLKRNPKQRISAKEALLDPWIHGNTISIPLKSRILDNLTSFQSKTRFRHAIITFIASQISSKEDNQELEKTFRTLDTDGNGVLSREELIVGYTKMLPHNSPEEVEKIVDELIQNVGMNKEGEINFTEFLVAAMNREKLLNSKQIEKAFKMFDDDGNGYIDLEELKLAMSGIKLSDEEWKNIITKYDVDGDGVVRKF
jgi:calcium-dependent protein kinase